MRESFIIMLLLVVELFIIIGSVNLFNSCVQT